MFIFSLKDPQLKGLKMSIFVTKLIEFRVGLFEILYGTIVPYFVGIRDLFAFFHAYHDIKHYLYYENVFKIRFFGR